MDVTVLHKKNTCNKNESDAKERKAVSNKSLSIGIPAEVQSLTSHVLHDPRAKASNYVNEVMGSTMIPAIGLVISGAPLVGTALAYLAFGALSGMVGAVVGGVEAVNEHNNCNSNAPKSTDVSSGNTVKHFSFFKNSEESSVSARQSAGSESEVLRKSI